jgi:predicted transcriptional regulator
MAGTVSQDIGGGASIELTLRGVLTGFRDRGVLHLLSGQKQLRAFSGSAGKVLEKLIEKKAMTPTQLAESLGTSSAAVLYGLRILRDEGIVERHKLPGGSVFYVLCWEVSIELPPSLAAKVEPTIQKLGGMSEIRKRPIRQLKQDLPGLTDDEFLEFLRFLAGGP